MSNRRKVRPGGAPSSHPLPYADAVAGGAPSSHPLPYADAVVEVAAALADRTAFIIWTPSPRYVADTARLLYPLSDDITTLIDSGNGLALRTVPVAVPFLMALSVPFVAVHLAPKSRVSAARLDDLLGPGRVPHDGSQDIIGIGDEERPMEWPFLLVDAIRQVEPAVAMMLMASDLRNQS